jgi:hypothetical protein
MKRKVRKNEATIERSKSVVSGRHHGSVPKSVNTSFALFPELLSAGTLGTHTDKQLRLTAHVPLHYVPTLTADRNVYQQNDLTGRKSTELTSYI